MNLSALAHLRATLLRQREDEQRAAAAQLEQHRHAEKLRDEQRQQFALAVGPVRALKPHGRAPTRRAGPAPEPRQTFLDEQAALREAWSDEVDIDTLLLTDDGLSYRRDGITPDVLNRLRRGQWTIQAELDLHGQRRDEAREALGAFLRQAQSNTHRCLRVVHGKGHGSPGREPVLKVRVQRWLAQSQAVVAFTQASGPQGGAGALIVLLRG